MVEAFSKRVYFQMGGYGRKMPSAYVPYPSVPSAAAPITPENIMLVLYPFSRKRREKIQISFLFRSPFIVLLSGKMEKIHNESKMSILEY